MSTTSSPARFAHLIRFWAAVTAPVTICTLASSLTPVIPTGSRIPPCSSTMYSCGRICMTSLSRGMATALAASMTLSTSSCETSWPFTAITPWLLKPFIWLPAIPMNTEPISRPAMSSASSIDLCMESTVLSIFTTTPFRRPTEG